MHHSGPRTAEKSPAYDSRTGAPRPEVGRCVRSGGTFTCLTFRRATDPHARYFQHQWEKSLFCHIYDDAELTQMLDDAGFEVVDMSGPSLVCLFTARKR